MRKLIFFPLLFLIALCGCESDVNPGHHTPEEIANAKPKPVVAAPVVTEQSAPVNTNGAQLYAQYCAGCHTGGKVGPSLEGVMNRREFPSGTPANDARLRETIRLGRAMMPAFGNTLTEAQIDAIVQYVHTL